MVGGSSFLTTKKERRRPHGGGAAFLPPTKEQLIANRKKISFGGRNDDAPKMLLLLRREQDLANFIFFQELENLRIFPALVKRILDEFLGIRELLLYWSTAFGRPCGRPHYSLLFSIPRSGALNNEDPPPNPSLRREGNANRRMVGGSSFLTTKQVRPIDHYK